MTAYPLRVSVDRGGTFTDVVATDAVGGTTVRKVPTPEDGADHDALLDVLREVAGVGPQAPIGADRISHVRYGTTAATNALLTLGGDPCALFVTRGFADLLVIGDQTRPDLFALDVRRLPPLHCAVVEVDERVLADGTVDCGLDRQRLAAEAERVLAQGVRSAAVVFVHAGVAPLHETLAGELLASLGFAHVALSHVVSGAPQMLERGATAVADAYLTPTLRRALTGFRAAFAADVDVRFLQSHGGLSDLDHATGPRAVLSGPAGGVIAVAAIAREFAETAVIGFDMGGTSTDVCRVAGEVLERVAVTHAAGRRLGVPSLRVETVAAGGGSILGFDGRRLTVGPASAGARPGPAGYGLGGPCTVTDADAVLGRIVPDRFPACFGPRGDAAFDVERARAALAPVAAAAGLGVEASALGFVRVADERMAQAVREVTVARGHDVREHALVAFGGAAGQHVCAVAELLDVARVIVPRRGSVLSAWGVGLARPAEEIAAPLLAIADPEGFARARELATHLRDRASAALRAQRVAPETTRVTVTAALRVVGVDATLDVPLSGDAETLALFHREHERLFGFARPGDQVEFVGVRARAEGAAPRSAAAPAVPPVRAAAVVRDVWFSVDGSPCALATPVLERASLAAGETVAGPALVNDGLTTVVLSPGWSALAERDGTLRLERSRRRSAPSATGARDPVTLALFANRFMAIAERMGAVLERVAHSTNIKERLDFSCAVFDGRGRLVANAPHIPVHLGAMGASVRAIAASRGLDLRDGDVLLTNDPYKGGSHLPDVTAVTPVRVEHGLPAFWVADRGHHADVGGVSPGSMPARSRTIDEEGVRLHDVLAVRGGRFDEVRVLRAFAASPYPARAPEERLADLRAQVAANVEGARLLRELTTQHGVDVVAAQMRHVLDDGAEAMEELLASLPDGAYGMEDALDDGTPLRVTVTVAGSRARVDFTGTGAARGSNLSAPHAVTHAAVLYALRTLVPRPISLNEGCLRPLEIVIPKGSLLDPQPPAAVVGGNVETSMRIVDLVLGALSACAASQGTMNNVAFGPDDDGARDRSAYYETLGGGMGAGPTFDGASAVQAHMTNTRITDVEVLERRWPVIVRRFAVRRGSGGAGAQRGGDGLIREIEAREPLRASLLSGRRTAGAFGLAGGGRGAPGINVLVRGGVETVLGGCAEVRLGAGDRLRVETPGGGGCTLSPCRTNESP